MGEGPVIFVLIWKCTCLRVFLRAWTDLQEPIGDGHPVGGAKRKQVELVAKATISRQ